MGFLDNYEASRERLERWLSTYPNGRIETRIVEFSAEKGYVLVEARAYRENDMIPAGIDYAYGYQAAYQPNMKRWFVEDTVTSAIMRVQQLVMGGAERTVREVMEQIETMPAKIANTDQDYDYWTTKHGDVPSYATAGEAEMAGIPSHGASEETHNHTCRHGQREWKQQSEANVAAGKKNWGGYFCPEKSKENQCDPEWYMFGSNGLWRAQ